MASRRVKKLSLGVLVVLVFVISFIGFSIGSAPLSLVNRFLPNGTTLNLVGTLKAGQITAVTVPLQNQLKTLPLQCEWQETAFLDFDLNCSQPFSATAQLKLGIFGSVQIDNLSANGQLSELEPWLSALEIPKGLGGEFTLAIDSAVISDMILQTLSLTADIKQLSYFNQPILPLVNVRTQQANNPIVIDTRADGDVRLFLESRIEDNVYLTKGEIQSNQLAHFQKFLRFLGKQTARDTWQVEMRGQLF